MMREIKVFKILLKKYLGKIRKLEDNFNMVLREACCQDGK
jgi:hypothetical protein